MIGRYFRAVRMSRLIPFLVIFVLFAMVFVRSASIRAQSGTGIIRVAPTGADTGGCGSAAAPCQSIQFAVQQAPSGSSILVAGGTYTYKASVDPCSFLVTRAVVCFVDKNLAILGGYATNDWSTSHPIANRTVIDGQNNVRGVAVVAYNTTATLRMEGFTIQNGLAQGAASGGDFNTYGFGGGMWAQTASVILRDVVFRNNRAIGGNTNAAYGGAGSGGGLAITSPKNNAASVLERVTFEGNQGLGGTGPERGGLALGGGLFTYEAVVSGSGLTFTNNRVVAGNSAGSGRSANLEADALGGAAAIQERSNVTLSNVTASGNQATGGNAGTTGGGAFGAAFYAELASFNLRDATLRQNTTRGGNAASGGVSFGAGLMTFNSNATIDRTEIIANTATSGASTSGGNAGSPTGGGAYVADFTNSKIVNVTNTIFAENRVVVGSPGTSIGGGGAGLTIQGLRAQVRHVTFARNTLGPSLVVGQAMLVQGTAGASGTPGIADVSYTIFAEHTGTPGASTLHVSAGSTANLNRGLFAGNTKNTNSDNQPLASGTFNGLNTMISAASGGFAANYRLSATSPAKDQAVGSTTPADIDNHRRPAGQAADIGADEYLVLDKQVRIPLVIR